MASAKSLYSGEFELSDNDETLRLLEITHQCSDELLMYGDNSCEKVNKFQLMVLEKCPDCNKDIVADFTREMKYFLKQQLA